MSRAARSLRWFAVYLGTLGAVLVLVPNLLLSLFGIPETREVWIRVVGVLVVDLGFYYWNAAVHESVPFFPLTVVARVLVFVSFVAFAALGLAPPVLVLFGAIDLAGAGWTAWAIYVDRRRASDEKLGVSPP